jgi:hypothetical protein
MEFSKGVRAGTQHPGTVGKHRKLIGIYQKKSEKLLAGILLPCSSHFRCFPASFLKDSVAGMTDLGNGKEKGNQ